MDPCRCGRICLLAMNAKIAARRYYRDALVQGIDRFFEPRRDDCAWCGSRDIRTCQSSPDIVQHKPGIFNLDKCRACEHVFQNPRLSAEGLNYYYRDTYDGLGEKSTEFGFGLAGRDYRRRARTLLPYATPQNWLDVGTGFGHFCQAARKIWPNTKFTGLDQGDGVLKGLRRGWIDEAHQGFFPELADVLTGRYDVVSMHHYLEHTIDPVAELRAAAQVLTPGGHLQIEVPDPDCVFAELFGSRWFQWMQPQHLHMFPSANLEKALTETGFSIVTVERGKADLGHDFVFAAAVVLNAFGPDPRRPWAPRSAKPLDYVRFATTMLLAAPVLLGAFVLDHTVRHLIPRHTNAYRIVARRD